MKILFSENIKETKGLHYFTCFQYCYFLESSCGLQTKEAQLNQEYYLSAHSFTILSHYLTIQAYPLSVKLKRFCHHFNQPIMS